MRVRFFGVVDLLIKAFISNVQSSIPINQKKEEKQLWVLIVSILVISLSLQNQ